MPYTYTNTAEAARLRRLRVGQFTLLSNPTAIVTIYKIDLRDLFRVPVRENAPGRAHRCKCLRMKRAIRRYLATAPEWQHNVVLVEAIHVEPMYSYALVQIISH